jgi:hypothetical protein
MAYHDDRTVDGRESRDRGTRARLVARRGVIDGQVRRSHLVASRP